MQDHRGLETIGTVYFTVSCLAALGFLIAMFRLPGDMSWLMIGSGVGVVLQGFTIQAVLGWMSVTAIELTGIRSELKSLKTTPASAPVRKWEGSSPPAAVGSEGIVEAWGGVRQCASCLRNLPAGEYTACPHWGASF